MYMAIITLEDARTLSNGVISNYLEWPWPKFQRHDILQRQFKNDTQDSCRPT